MDTRWRRLRTADDFTGLACAQAVAFDQDIMTAILQPDGNGLSPDEISTSTRELLRQAKDRRNKYVKLTAADDEAKVIAYAAFTEVCDDDEEGINARSTGKDTTDPAPERHSEAHGLLKSKLREMRVRCIGERKHIYLRLLITHPNHRRKGAATTLLHLLQHHVRTVYSAFHLPIYLIATPVAYPLYLREGFCELDRLTITATDFGLDPSEWPDTDRIMMLWQGIWLPTAGDPAVTAKWTPPVLSPAPAA